MQASQNMAHSLPVITANALQKLRNVPFLEWFAAKGIQLSYFQELEEALIIIQLDAEQKQAVDGDAEQMQAVDGDAELRNSLQQLEDVLTDMDRYFRNAAGIGRKVTGRTRSLIPRAFLVGRLMGNKMGDFKKRLKDISSALKAEKRGRLAKEYLEHTLRETSFEPTFDIIGRLREKEFIIGCLMHPDYVVVHLCGISGIGKTALAKLVFNDPRIESYFESKVWITIQFDWNLKQLTINLIYSITGERYSGGNMDELLHKLRDILHRTRCLIILDDMNILSDGDCYEFFGKVQATGSGVVAISDRSLPDLPYWTLIELEGLSDRDSFSLFLKVAFEKGEQERYPNLNEIGKQIVNKCRGVPLAVITLGHLLCTTKSEKYWGSIRDDRIWTSAPEFTNGILPSAILSYNQLTPNLGQCFAYLSLFPKNYKFCGVELVQFWMANGLLPSLGIVEDPEDIGMQYLKMLRSRFVFKDFEEDGSDVKFKMQGSMHDLALSLASNESGLRNLTNDFSCNSSQHFSFVGPQVFQGEDAAKFYQSDAVQTLIFFRLPQISFIEELILKGRFLKTLMLKNSSFKEFPRGIENLKALKYLDLSRNEELREIPNSICKLRTLQTLMFQDCAQIQELPRDIRHMVGLRMLTITTKQSFLPENGIAGLNSLRYLAILGCQNLQYLPQGIHLLSSLRTLLIRDCDKLIKLPRSIKYLVMLEKLVIVNCKMLQLNTKAEMKGNEDDHQDYLIGSGLSLHQLWIAKVEKLEALPQWLIRSANTLLHLHIEDCPKLKILPKWFQNLKSLEKLEILKCPLLSTSGGEEDKYGDLVNLINGTGRLQQVQIKSLPQLVKLPGWLAPLSSTTLVFLHIEDCPRLEILPWWLAQLSSTTLAFLHIKDCQSLTKLPVQLLQNLSSLRDLEILGCPSLELLDTNKEESDVQAPEQESNCGSHQLLRLRIVSSQKLVESPSSRWFVHLFGTTLSYLRIEDCPSLEALPTWIQNFTSLGTLEIFRCPKLLSLRRGMQNLTALKQLNIQQCPLLWDSRSDWLTYFHDIEIYIDFLRYYYVASRFWPIHWRLEQAGTSLDY